MGNLFVEVTSEFQDGVQVLRYFGIINMDMCRRLLFSGHVESSSFVAVRMVGISKNIFKRISSVNAMLCEVFLCSHKYANKIL